VASSRESRRRSARGHHADRAARRDGGLLGSLLRSGEDRLGEIAGDLLGRKSVQKALERAILHAYDTKARFDRSIARTLRAMNLPTRREVQKLKAEVRAMRAELEELSHQLARRRAAPRRSGARHTGKPGPGG